MQTDRLRLRPWTSDDADRLYDIRSRPEVSEWLAEPAPWTDRSQAIEAIERGLAELPGIPGRVERIDEGQPFAVFVDYAHTDDALSKLLEALRPVTQGQLSVVFGCGGDRDRTKRAPMADSQAAVRHERESA